MYGGFHRGAIGTLPGLLVGAAVALLASASAADAGTIVEDGLEAFLSFDEGVGATTADQTGNGHSGTLVGASWASGAITCSGEGQVVQIAAGPQLRAPTFTYDLWFEANDYTGAYGRLIAQAEQSGGDGPDVLESYGYVAIRISSGSDAVFAQPTIGSLSTPAPPDHFGICAAAFHREDGPEHLLVTHDSASSTVRMFIGLAGAPLRLCFEAEYSGSYSVDTGPVAICNHPEPDHVFRGNYYQFAYYSRTLTHQVDGNNNVTGGEIFANHQAGAAAELSAPAQPDAGPADASPDDDGEVDGGAVGDAGALPGRDADQGAGFDEPALHGGCATSALPPDASWWLWLVALSLLVTRKRGIQLPGTHHEQRRALRQLESGRRLSRPSASRG